MPAALAVAAITTTGYVGNLVGPAVIGFVAKAVGLPVPSGCSPHLSELLSERASGYAAASLTGAS